MTVCLLQKVSPPQKGLTSLKKPLVVHHLLDYLKERKKLKRFLLVCTEQIDADSKEA